MNVRLKSMPTFWSNVPPKSASSDADEGPWADEGATGDGDIVSAKGWHQLINELCEITIESIVDRVAIGIKINVPRFYGNLLHGTSGCYFGDPRDLKIPHI